MKLLTVDIQEKAEKQYDLGSDLNQKVVAKFFNPIGSWTWYLMNKDPDSSYCWGIVNGDAVGMGSFDIEELANIELQWGLGIERDMSFTPKNAKDIWDKLIKERG